jgi:flavin reductase (DIM6/NTAB) family NADH-FMN oxidoreductase RutF
MDVAETFAELVGDLEYPMFIVTANWFAGRVLWRHDAGDHDAFLLEPIAAESGSAEGEFTFHRAKRIEAGHEAAPNQRA